MSVFIGYRQVNVTWLILVHNYHDLFMSFTCILPYSYSIIIYFLAPFFAIVDPEFWTSLSPRIKQFWLLCLDAWLALSKLAYSPFVIRIALLIIIYQAVQAKAQDSTIIQQATENLPKCLFWLGREEKYMFIGTLMKQ